MKWVKHDSACIVSDDGRYSICRIGGKDGSYEVYRRRTHPEGPHLVASNIADAKEARKLAEADSRD